MQLSKLIGEGEKFEKGTEEEFHNKRGFEEKGNRWVDKSISFLKQNYPESVLTSDFVSESEKIDKNYHNMVSILKGLMDVEAELGLLDDQGPKS